MASGVRPYELNRWRALPLFLGALVLAALAVRHVAPLAHAMGQRLFFPHPLEWMEGGQLVNAARLLQGEPIYTPCDQGYVSLPYPPVHFAVLALAGALFGLDYGTGRAVSLVALLACATLLSREVWRAAPTQLSREVMVLLVLGAIAAGYPIVDGWYDLVRVDMLLAALLIGAATCCFQVPVTTGHAVGADVLLALACYTKQTAVLYAPWLGFVVLLRNRRAAGWLVGITTFLGGCTLLGLQQWSDGWFWQTNVSLLAGHELIPALTWRAAKLFASHAPYLPMTVVLVIVAAFKGWLSSRTWPWVGMLLVAIPQCLWAASKVAAHINNLMLAVLLAGPVTLMVVGDVATALRKAGQLRAWVLWPVMALCGVQLWLWDPATERYLPTAAAWRQARDLNRFVAALPGEVVAPGHPFVPVRNGKGVDQPITQAYHDHGVLTQDVVDLVGCMGQSPARWLVLNADNPTNFMRGLTHRYFERRRGTPRGPATLSGYGAWVTGHFERRVELPRRDVRVLFDFETGNYDGWMLRGEAFAAGPLRAPHHVRGYGGHYVASSWHPQKGDGATGKLVSPKFEINRDYLAFTVGGGRSQRTAVELVVDGVQLRNAMGWRSEVLVPVLWDVYALRGRLAQIRVVDRVTRGWGHVHLDDVVLFNAGEGQEAQSGSSPDRVRSP